MPALVRFLLPGAGLALAACGSFSPVPAHSPSPVLRSDHFTSFDQHPLPYRQWLPAGEVRLVVIGMHGIAGASNDMENLGGHLPGHLPGTAVYAPDLRGQGNDPLPEQRGDIRRPEEWFEDLATFTALVKSAHPGVPVVWAGESMGSLIALHACAYHSTNGPSPCDGLILASPVTTIGQGISPLRRFLLRIAAALLPRYRLSLEGLFGVDEVQITSDTIHQEQVVGNPWHLSSFTLRLLRTVERLILTLPDRAAAIPVPVLLLHGGNDVFSDPSGVRSLAAGFPSETPVDRRLYPQSHHLLFYDQEREQVLRDVTTWLRELRASK